MAPILTPDELSRARKIAAMLSATTDGERLNALALLTAMAKTKKLRVDELLVMLGDPAKAPPSPGQRPPGWDWATRQPPPRPERGDERDWFSEMMRAEQRRRQERDAAQADAMNRARQATEAARKASAERSLKARVEALRAISKARLSAWEQEFVASIEAKAQSPFWQP